MIDFFRDTRFKALRKQMGIKEGVYANFEGLKRNIYGSKLTEIEIKAIENNGDVDITIDKIDFSEKDPILRVGKVNVILYMRDQYYPNKHEYKYHIAWCDTLEERREEKRIKRYVITRNKTGNFNVTKIDRNQNKIIEKNGKCPMKVCKGCLKKINYKGYKNAKYHKKNEIYNQFSLEKFLEEDKRKKGYIPKEIKLESEFVKSIGVYPENWSAISKSYRSVKNWTCEKCGKDCSNNHGGLDTHHINYDKSDVRNENLMALCKKCHEKEHIH